MDNFSVLKQMDKFVEVKTNKKKKTVFKYLVSIFLIYAAVYGTVSVFTTNMTVRSIKDIVLVLLVFYSLQKFLRIEVKSNRAPIILIFFLILITITSILGVLSTKDWVSFIYGLKITVFPMGAIFIGMLVGKNNVNIDKIYLFIFVSLIVAWIIQYNIGLERLLGMGFEYGVNVKNFNANQLRLPSLAGTPDAYAFLLCIMGVLVEYRFLSKDRKVMSWLIKGITLLFLALATIRSAIMLWSVFQFFLFVEYIRKMKTKTKLFLLSCLFFTAAMIPILWFFIIKNSTIGSNSSFQDRLSHWASHIPSFFSIDGLIGYGLGAVGSASRRTSMLGYESSDYAVDNQYIALYEQIGWFGSIVLILFFLFILKLLIQNRKCKDNINLIAIPLLIGMCISCIFTNTLEIYPFNVFFWIILGMGIVSYNSPRDAEIKK